MQGYFQFFILMPGSYRLRRGKGNPRREMQAGNEKGDRMIIRSLFSPEAHMWILKSLQLFLLRL